MEGEGRPAELTAMIGGLRSAAAALTGGGEWLAAAVDASWKGAAALLDVDGLADSGPGRSGPRGRPVRGGGTR